MSRPLAFPSRAGRLLLLLFAVTLGPFLLAALAGGWLVLTLSPLGSAETWYLASHPLHAAADYIMVIKQAREQRDQADTQTAANDKRKPARKHLVPPNLSRSSLILHRRTVHQRPQRHHNKSSFGLFYWPIRRMVLMELAWSLCDLSAPSLTILCVELEQNQSLTAKTLQQKLVDILKQLRYLLQIRYLFRGR